MNDQKTRKNKNHAKETPLRLAPRAQNQKPKNANGKRQPPDRPADTHLDSEPSEGSQDSCCEKRHQDRGVDALGSYYEEGPNEERQSVQTECRCRDELQSLRVGGSRAHTHKLSR
jgi:hypothetical protein